MMRAILAIIAVGFLGTAHAQMKVGAQLETNKKTSSQESMIRVSKEALNLLSPISSQKQDTFSVALRHMPKGVIKIHLSVEKNGAGKLSTNELVFTPSSWNIAREVTVTGQFGAREMATAVHLKVSDQSSDGAGHEARVRLHLCGAKQYAVDNQRCADMSEAGLSAQKDGKVVPSSMEFVAIPAGTFNKKRMEAFQLARTPTTVRQYQACVAAGKCSSDNYRLFNSEEAPYCNYRRGDYWLNHPMNCVNWHGAKEFCEWFGGRLPTAEEWEYAATHDGAKARPTTYPWGNEKPLHCVHASYYSARNHCDGTIVVPGMAGTSAVGSYSPKGDSPLGLQDMAGNVWEWTSSLWSSESDLYRIKGGSWYVNALDLPVSNRNDWYPGDRDVNLGFRCVAPSR